MKEHKNKLSLKGNKNGAGNKGRVYSPETLAKMSSVKYGNTNKAGKWDKEIEKLDPRKTPGFRGPWLVSLVNQKKQVAIQRNKSWDLSRIDAAKLLTQECSYCSFKGDINEMGIDRIDSSLGYESNNCVSCCKTCNFAKNSMSVEDFKSWITKIYHNFVTPHVEKVTK